jgi:hypothetical protein
MFHSRDVAQIMGHLEGRIGKDASGTGAMDLERSRKVREDLVGTISSLI